MVSINTTSVKKQQNMFRSFQEGESRAPLLVDSTSESGSGDKGENAAAENAGENGHLVPPSYGRKSGRCAASECHLICKDIWTWRLENNVEGHANIYLHPTVKLYYNHWSKFLHTWITPVFDMFHRWCDWWSDRGESESGGGGESESGGGGGGSVDSFPVEPPMNVKCGGGDDECGDSGRVLVPKNHPCRYV